MARFVATDSIKYRGKFRRPGGRPFEVADDDVEVLGDLIQPVAGKSPGKRTAAAATPNTAKGSKADDTSKAGGGKKPPALVSVNKASAAEIAEAAKGIGDERAADIVAWRDEHGNFESLDDLAKIDGISQTIVDDNRDALTV